LTLNDEITFNFFSDIKPLVFDELWFILLCDGPLQSLP